MGPMIISRKNIISLVGSNIFFPIKITPAIGIIARTAIYEKINLIIVFFSSPRLFL
ncbi:MAG: hypothetical protein M1475_03465 [Actinobacteria bacterium]|nr:hypothetical protein [Actinomycetota bacterium]MCL6087448.1 hypothetical protein [Actinomycetota bacterium]